jgi:hypothetical protein
MSETTTIKKHNDKQDVAMAVLATDVGYIKRSIENIEHQLKVMENNFATKTELGAVKAEFDSLDKDKELRIRRLETWGFTSIGALIVIQFALNYFK